MAEAMFLELGLKKANLLLSSSKKEKLKRFKGWYGLHPRTCAVVWNKMQNTASEKPIHFLMMLFFLKQYTSEKIIAGVFGSAEKTIPSRVWNMILKVQLMFEQTVSDL